MRTRLDRQIHVHRVALPPLDRPVLPAQRCQTFVCNVRRTGMIGVGHVAKAGGRAWGTGRSCESCEVISRWWRARAPANTATNVRARAAPVCVAMVTPRRVGQDCAPPPSLCAERELGLAEVPRWRHGKRRGVTDLTARGDHAAANAAPRSTCWRAVGSSEQCLLPLKEGAAPSLRGSR